MELEISDLPEEVLCLILKEVVTDAVSFRAVAQVCTTWRRLAYDEELRYIRGVTFESLVRGLDDCMVYDRKLVREWPTLGLFTDEEEKYILAKQNVHYSSSFSSKLMLGAEIPESVCKTFSRNVARQNPDAHTAFTRARYDLDQIGDALRM